MTMKIEHKAIVIVSMIGVGFWLLDCAVDTWLYGTGSYFDYLLGRHSPLEIYFRSIILALFIAFSLVISRLIARQRQARRELKDQLDFLSSVVDSIDHPFFVIDAEDRSVRLQNSAAKKRCKVQRDMACCELLNVRSGNGKDIIENVKTSGSTCSFEQSHETENGQKHEHEIHAFPLLDHDEEVTGVIVHCIDVTVRKQIEESLIRAERLHAARELSAGITHNLNNLLTALMAPVYVLEDLVDSPEAAEVVEVIQSSAHEIGDLVKRLNQSLRSGDQQTHAVRVNQVIEAAVLATRPKWRDEANARGISIEVNTVLSQVPDVRGTEWGLEDVLVNLILNAIDAMPEGGMITITSSATGAGVMVAVRDTGVGMDSETCKRVFEPLFTTKKDLGTGLGLAAVQATISSWGGEVGVESSPGAGTGFSLELPPAEVQPDEEEIVEEPVTSHRARILVVDDDELICRFLIRALGKEHEVEAVQDSRQAIAQFTAGRWDVALIDLSMPGLPGDHVARAFKETDPTVATVLVTGWEMPADDPRVAVFDLTLQKPFTGARTLRNVVAQGVQLHDQLRAAAEPGQS
jgi:signal transduction histidine kinase